MNKITMEQVVCEAIAAHPGAFLTDLAQWFSHNDNWLIWSAFSYHADAAWRANRPRYSARTIGEYLRHNTLLSDSGADFKINDHIWPDLARLYMLVHPERHGFFETRGRRAA